MRYTQYDNIRAIPLAGSDDLLPLRNGAEHCALTELRFANESFMKPNRCLCAPRRKRIWSRSRIGQKAT